MALRDLFRRRARPSTEPALPVSAATVAIIMDGNGRWARRRGLPVAAGHRAGTQALKRVVDAAPDLGIRTLCVYAFSTENWARPEDEVYDLMGLFAETIRREFQDLHREGVRIRFMGRRDRAGETLLRLIEETEEQTRENQRLDLIIAFDYGSRAELVEAARRIITDGLTAAEVDEAALRARLLLPDMPDPDLVIRTSGEQRLSNFLLWQSAYSELVFSPRYWPDFDAAALREALEEYAGRRRRFGGR